MAQRRSDHQLVVAAIGRVVFLDVIEHLHHAEHARLEQRVAIKHDFIAHRLQFFIGKHRRLALFHEVDHRRHADDAEYHAPPAQSGSPQ